MPKPFNHHDEFWKQVVKERALSPELVEAHRRHLHETPWTPLGRILIYEKVLTVRQVMGIIAMQIEEPHIRIGDLAVREGMCTQEQVAHCLELQARSSPGPIHTLLKDKNVSESRLINALVGYIHFLEGQAERRKDEAELVGSAY